MQLQPFRFSVTDVRAASAAFLFLSHRFYYRAAWNDSDKNSVCPSVRPPVCPSHACIVTKR